MRGEKQGAEVTMEGGGGGRCVFGRAKVEGGEGPGGDACVCGGTKKQREKQKEETR